MRLLPHIGISRRGNLHGGWGPFHSTLSSRRTGNLIGRFVALALLLIAYATPGILILMLFTWRGFMSVEGAYFYQALIISTVIYLLLALLMIAAREQPHHAAASNPPRRPRRALPGFCAGCGAEIPDPPGRYCSSCGRKLSG